MARLERTTRSKLPLTSFIACSISWKGPDHSFDDHSSAVHAAPDPRISREANEIFLRSDGNPRIASPLDERAVVRCNHESWFVSARSHPSASHKSGFTSPSLPKGTKRIRSGTGQMESWAPRPGPISLESRPPLPGPTSDRHGERFPRPAGISRADNCARHRRICSVHAAATAPAETPRRSATALTR